MVHLLEKTRKECVYMEMWRLFCHGPGGNIENRIESISPHVTIVHGLSVQVFNHLQ